MAAALALCHTVLPTVDELTAQTSYQASSPDEMAFVQFGVNELGFELVDRDQTKIVLDIRTPRGLKNVPMVSDRLVFRIVETFQFTSTRKRMGIIVQDTRTQRFYYLLKGAEVAVVPRLAYTPQWLTEALDNLAKTGLRTLVYAWLPLEPDQVVSFQQQYEIAKTSLEHRESKCNTVIQSLLEENMEVLGVTGVEDELQDNVPESIESLSQAGIKLFMVTGDKIETALCIATSTGLKGRHDMLVHAVSEKCHSISDLRAVLNRLASGHTSMSASVRGSAVVLVVDSQCIEMILTGSSGGASVESRGGGSAYSAGGRMDLGSLFVAAVLNTKSVLCCRCSPTQKSEIIRLLKTHSKLRIAAIGDGGNDVPMIQASHCGIGIEGLEGKQASLAADFSISQFSSVRKLVLWHGRLSQLRSTKLTKFILHRGLTIGAIQIIFSSLFYFTPIALFQGWLQVGYTTYYTMLPVFSLILDRDVPPTVAFLFPELYQLQVRSQHTLDDLAFFRILFKSIYQGASVMLGALALFEKQLINFAAIAFTSLVLSELLNVVSDIMTWHWMMGVAEILSILIYAGSIFLLPQYFDLKFVSTSDFWAKVAVITLIGWLPVHMYKVLRKCVNPPQYTKLIT